MPLAPHDVIRLANLAPLREAFERAGYDEAACEAAQSLVNRLGQPNPAEVAAALPVPEALRDMLRLWALGQSLDVGRARDLLGGALVDELSRLGMLKPEGGGRVAAELSILPSDGLLTTRDFDSLITERPAADDYVLGIGPSARRVASIMIPGACGSVLDIGTGQGFLATVAAGAATRVIATDINARALSMAAVAASLSRAPNIEFRQGSFYEPVAGLEGQFDRVICNPPFVIQPSNTRVCFTSGEGGDRNFEHIIRRGCAFLAPGGWLSTWGNWAHTDDDDWHERPMAWVKGQGCDLWAVRTRTWTPRAYAKMWIGELTANGASADRSMNLDDWMAYYEREGIRSISMGGVIVRRREGQNWARWDTMTLDSVRGAAGEQIRRIFDNQTLRTEQPGLDVLDLPLVPAASLEIEQRHHPRAGGGFELASATVRDRVGVPQPVGVQMATLDLIARLDGRRTVRQALHDAAAQRGLSDPGEEGARGVVAALMEHGHVLVPAQM